jgi:pimeloyl-ACP methyl ester carboxylesterase
MVQKIKIVTLVLFTVLSVSVFAGEPSILFWNTETDYFDKINFGNIEYKPKGFDGNEKTVVLIHGWTGNARSDDYKIFAKQIKKFEPKTNVFSLDWSLQQITDVEPVTTSKVIPKVADWAYMKLFSFGKGLGIQADKLHLIGFSHGSHVAALIGKRTDGNIKHVTLLDPSTSKSHLLTWENLFGKGWTASESAKFVDMYKTSHWAGTHYARGDKSFYVRQKGTQVKERSIERIRINHYYAFRWYLSTVGNKETRFGYSIKVLRESEPSWIGTIESTLPRDGSLQDMGKTWENELFENKSTKSEQ